MSEEARDIDFNRDAARFMRWFGDDPDGATMAHVKLHARVAELEAITSKLPRTADGVPIIPHITEAVWHPVHGECWIANEVGASYYPPQRPRGPADMVLISECYSTPQAARQSATAQQEGEAGDE